MALFSYKGLAPNGKEIKNSLNAESQQQAKQKIKALGVMLISIKEEKADSSKDANKISFGKKVNITDIALMTRQLATLLKAKIQVVQALSALVDQTDNPHLRVILSDVRQKVNEGSSLSDAIAEYPKVFDNVYINMVDAGEQSGTLELVLLRLAEFSEAQVKLTAKIKGAMTYPMIMVVFGTIMMAVIFTFVIPQITKIFVKQKKKLPMPTEIAIFISDMFTNYWWAMIIVAFLSYIAFFKYIRTVKGEAKWHAFLLKVPFIKDVVMMINVSRFCQTLSTLMESGVPILMAMKIVSNIVSNVHMRKAVNDARINITEGGSIADPLAESGLFPKMVTHMIKLGEKSGEVEEMLGIVAENYETELNTKLGKLTTILEPIMLICMGMAVLFIIFAVVMPMMEMTKIGR